MGAINWLWPFKRYNNIENPNVPLTGSNLEQFGTGYHSKAGQDVTAKKALMIAPVWQAVAMISGDVAKLPLNLYRRAPELSESAKVVDKTHPAYYAVARKANPVDHAYKIWRRAMTHALIWNQAFIWVHRPRPRQIELYNLLPDRMTYDPTPTEDSPGGIYYYEAQRDRREPPVSALYPSEVIHIEGLAFGGGRPYECELVRQARDSWGVALAMQDFKSRFYKNYGHAGGYLEIPAHFTEKAAANLEEGFRKRQSGGSDSWFKAVVLRDGAKFHQSTIDPEKQQLSEATEDMAIEIARWFNLQPSRLGVRSAVSYGSKAEDNQGYYDQTLSHWTKAIECECHCKLLTEAEQRADSHLFAHDIHQLVASNPQVQAEIGRTEIEIGAITVNEYRSQTNRNPIAGGDRRIVPMNFYVVDADGTVKTPETIGADANGDAVETPAAGSPTADEAENARDVLSAAVGYQVSRWIKRLRTEVARKTPENFLGWWDRSKTQRLQEFAKAVDGPVAVYRHVTGQNPEDAVLGVARRFSEAVEGVLSTETAENMRQALSVALDEFNSNPFEGRDE